MSPPLRPKVRLAYLVSHPIHYQAPLLRRVAADPDIELTVFFQSDLSLRPMRDAGFGVEVSWDVDLTGGYRHEVLPALAGRDALGCFLPWSYGLTRRLRDGGFDVLWVHGYAIFHNLTAMLAARRLGLRVLVRDEATPLSRSRGWPRRLLKRAFFGVLRGLCDGFLTIGGLNAAYYRQNGIPEHRLFPMPYAVDNAYFRQAVAEARRARPSLRERLGIEAGAPVVLYVSKLQPRKHADELLAAYARIAERPELGRPWLILVGEGALRPVLEAEIARLNLERVRLVGFVGQREVPAFLALADVFVLPSVHEPWGLAVNEAMNAGLPVIVTDQVGCAADLVVDGVNGVVLKPHDTAGLADALADLLADPDKRRRMGENGLARIATWDYAADLRGLRRALGLEP